MLVLSGTGGQVVAGLQGSPSPEGVALAFGLAVGVLVYTLGGVSGAHLNPAVSFGLAVQGSFPWRRLPAYWAAQLAGAILGSSLLSALFAEAAAAGVTRPVGGTLPAFALESLFTALLVAVVVAAVRGGSPPPVAAPAVGALITLGALVAGPVSGGSFNPARSLAPALLTGIWEGHALYWVAPLLGAAVAGLGTRLAARAGEARLPAAGAPARRPSRAE